MPLRIPVVLVAVVLPAFVWAGDGAAAGFTVAGEQYRNKVELLNDAFELYWTAHSDDISLALAAHTRSADAWVSLAFNGAHTEGSGDVIVGLQGRNAVLDMTAGTLAPTNETDAPSQLSDAAVVAGTGRLADWTVLRVRRPYAASGQGDAPIRTNGQPTNVAWAWGTPGELPLAQHGPSQASRGGALLALTVVEPVGGGGDDDDGGFSFYDDDSDEPEIDWRVALSIAMVVGWSSLLVLLVATYFSFAGVRSRWLAKQEEAAQGLTDKTDHAGAEDSTGRASE